MHNSSDYITAMHMHVYIKSGSIIARKEISRHLLYFKATKSNTYLVLPTNKLHQFNENQNEYFFILEVSPCHFTTLGNVSYYFFSFMDVQTSVIRGFPLVDSEAKSSKLAQILYATSFDFMKLKTQNNRMFCMNILC